ncbi:hypothetical protein VCSRO111_0620 [Vibrio cholerae]|uniref:HNH endonuclease n=1 Tax=Vibrio cholerae TaxID=666 RepID=UPI0011DBE54F|nr:HNH endonuclease [Vibrio cholerae]TXY57650.1 hypothetical protein FXE91_10860 [Vibrio cholerae]GHX89585.1 hypothetical protein VCSRO111_0620 [Vibrio cholerae]
MKVTQGELREILNYDKETGRFTWIHPPKHHQGLIGKEAGVINSGYRKIKINGKRYSAHVLAWIYTYGEKPTKCIDHINGISTDNRIENLRLASNSENQANRARNKGKKISKGVRVLPSGKYQARISFKSKLITIGTFDTEREAANAYLNRATELYLQFARAA